MTDAPSSMKPKTSTTVKGKVVDIFGNLVPGNSVTASTAGDITQLPCVRTLGGHRRFPADEVYRLLGGESASAE
ncbi:MAG: MerR family DNA-binding transcriptional regulator [Actinomycetota bacterium]